MLADRIDVALLSHGLRADRLAAVREQDVVSEARDVHHAFPERLQGANDLGLRGRVARPRLLDEVGEESGENLNLLRRARNRKRPPARGDRRAGTLLDGAQQRIAGTENADRVDIIGYGQFHRRGIH